MSTEQNENAGVPETETLDKETNYGICTDPLILRQKSEEVTDIEAIPEHLWERMVKHTLATPNGIGLAAIQLGIPLRIAVLVDRNDKSHMRIVNPVILKKKSPKWVDESCLSIPGRTFKTKRYMKITVKHDLAEEPVEFKGLWAHALQHEDNHMDGILVSDVALRMDNIAGARHNRAVKARIKSKQSKASRRKNRKKK